MFSLSFEFCDKIEKTKLDDREDLTMLEKINLKKTMIDAEYKQMTRALKADLSVLQHSLKERKIPVIVLFDGWGAAGKGSIIADVILNLDPRNFKVMSTLEPTEEERRHPFLWRHWCRIPARGRIAIFDRSWYPEVSVERVEKGLSDMETYRRMDDINAFERQLTDDGYLMVKFFLHISQKDQKKRLERLAEDKDTAWRVTDKDWKRNKHYDEHCRAFDEMLERTNTPNAPWHIVPSHDKNCAMAEIYRVLVESIREAIAAADEAKVNPPAPPVQTRPSGYPLVKVPRLEDVRLDMAIDPVEYKELLKKDQKRLADLHNKLYRQRIPVVAVYEGWDAAGKGGNIRRLVTGLDPRGYEVVPIASPTPDELAHHYLWRFWKALPKDGHVAIFDRSWYGRVMVERIEGFCTEVEWKRAFAEINEFERELCDWGAIVLKFWLHIDRDEQLRRFNDRENTPEKRWKITDEDWRNREKWDQYEVAVNDMLRETSTDFAPWTIVESQDKKFARIKAMEAFIDAVKARV